MWLRLMDRVRVRVCFFRLGLGIVLKVQVQG